MDSNKYDSTISSSREESFARAVDLFFQELENMPKPKVPRPEVPYGRVILCFAAWLSPILLAVILVLHFASEMVWSPWIIAGVALVSTLVFLKRIVVYLILLYQRFAPERIRAACVFEPSCSNYMLQAIEKHGVFRGVAKGIRRLLRCHYPNCGVDYP